MDNKPKKYLLGYAGNTAGITEDDAKKLTHINLAFGQLNLDGSICVNQLTILEQLPQIRSWNPEIKIMLSVVPHHPDAFTHNCATPEGRQAVARSCAEIVQSEKLDGIDLDWEYPCVPSNGANSPPKGPTTSSAGGMG